jgi:hypothetical protein
MKRKFWFSCKSCGDKYQVQVKRGGFVHGCSKKAVK